MTVVDCKKQKTKPNQPAKTLMEQEGEKRETGNISRHSDGSSPEIHRPQNSSDLTFLPSQ